MRRQSRKMREARAVSLRPDPMVTFLCVLGTVLFALALLLGVAATAFGLPGTILILLDAVIYSACTHWQHPPLWVLLVLVALAAVAETADNILGYSGVRRSGGTSKTGLWAMAGGLAGVFVGGWVSPLLGALGLTGGLAGVVFGVLLPPIACGLLGGYLGGYIFELRQGKSRSEAAQAGKGALIGRLHGALAKMLLAGVMVALIVSTLRA
jgi:uncharacterized protein YqgC (DUF456 family)